MMQVNFISQVVLGHCWNHPAVFNSMSVFETGEAHSYLRRSSRQGSIIRVL